LAGAIYVEYLTAAQAAEILHVTPWRITEACRNRTLKASKIGKAWLIAPADLAAYVDAHRNDRDDQDAA